MVFRTSQQKKIFTIGIAGISLFAVLTSLCVDGKVWCLLLEWCEAVWMGRIFTRLARSTEMHVKCRNCKYAQQDFARVPVADKLVSWQVAWPDYKPTIFTHKCVSAGPVWADPDIGSPGFSPKWNQLDGKVNRKSHKGVYDVVDGKPRNPCGRTGVADRGILGKWGPNHAADPIVTRWKREVPADVSSGKSSSKGRIKVQDGKPVLQFVAVFRRDTKEWAIPGGMVDAGESVTQTLRREFGEEALNSLEADTKTKQTIEKNVNKLFTEGVEIFCGYVDDPRNTDNAWMETVAVNFHDELGDGVAKFDLAAGDDAAHVKWMDVGRELKLYASHLNFLHETAKLRQAFW